jgi:hypothetical protein
VGHANASEPLAGIRVPFATSLQRGKSEKVKSRRVLSGDAAPPPQRSVATTLLLPPPRSSGEKSTPSRCDAFATAPESVSDA